MSTFPAVLSKLRQVRTNNAMAKQAIPLKKQTFSFNAPNARSVQLVGNFTHWQQAPINLKRGADGIWRAVIELKPGTYHYRFLVDGEWQDDPECTLRVANPFGSQNSVRQVA
jgi:1,4-alpha-glucan branching enzyme